MKDVRALNRSTFEIFSKKVFNELQGNEALTLTISGEETHFSRLSKARVRQITDLYQAFVTFSYIKGNKTMSFTLPFKGTEEDFVLAQKKLKESREWISHLPDDPYLVRPQYYGVTNDENLSSLPEAKEMLAEVLDHSSKTDLAGVFSSGDIVRATMNSEGQFHWFKTRNFYLDYSLYNDKQKAVKSLYADREWSSDVLKRNLSDSTYKLSLMDRPSKKIERGTYRVFLAPSAVSELLSTLSWGGVSMGDHQRGNGSLRDLWQGKRKMSEKFTLKEDFSLGLTPRFNEMGEVADPVLPIIENGVLKNFLTSTRTANEYKIASNNSSEWESLRSPMINTGTLKREDIYKEIGTGLYLSDLHYLNWSDRETARLTGMTRYACFWIENGEIASPIQDLRFDESFYNLFGDSLIDLTSDSEIIPNVGSYFERDVGGSRTPGLLVGEFKFTL